MTTVYEAAGSSVLSQHAAHLLAIGIPAGMVVVGLTWDSLRKRAHRVRPGLSLSAPLLIAALASLTAAGVHVAVTPEHFRESTLYGAFFVVTATAQVAVAAALVVARSPLVVGMAAAGNGLVIALWLVTRTLGIPLGPEAGTVEHFQRLDVLASGCEALVVVCCIAALHRVVAAPRSVPAL